MKPVRTIILIFIATTFLAGLSIAQPRTLESRSQQPPETTGPLTLQDLNLLLRRSVGRNMTESDVAARVQRFGIDFSPTPEAMAKLRSNGAHPSLINAIKRAGDKFSPNSDVIVTTKVNVTDPIIDEVRKNVRDYIEEMPDFICTQEVERFIDTDGSGAWARRDSLRYEITYSRKGEAMKPLATNGLLAPPKPNFGKGATSAGEFASALASLFDPKTEAVFKPAGKEKLGTHEALIYDYRVAQPKSQLVVSINDDPPFTPGYAGSVWIDANTKQVLRIEQAIENPPAQYRTFSGDKIIDYELVKLRGTDVEVLLPIKAEVTMLDRAQKGYSQNLIYFKFYRKFESDVKFITDEEPKPEKPEKPEKP